MTSLTDTQKPSRYPIASRYPADTQTPSRYTDTKQIARYPIYIKIPRRYQELMFLPDKISPIQEIEYPCVGNGHDVESSYFRGVPTARDALKHLFVWVTDYS